MSHTQINPEPSAPQHVIDDLLARGISYDDIQLGMIHQQAQRRSGVAVLPLAVIVGADAADFNRHHKVGSTTAKMLRKQPPPRKSAGGTHITGAKIWAGSVQTGTEEEADFVRAITPEQADRFYRVSNLAADKALELATSARAGKDLETQDRMVMGFTNSCRKVLQKLVNEIQYRKGWCMLSYETLMDRTKLSRGTIHNALKALRAIGLISWKRRYNYTHSVEHGSRSEQTSNLYRLEFPKWLFKLLGLDTPIPDDMAAHQEATIEDHALMLASASKSERRRLMPTSISGRASLITAAVRIDSRISFDGRTRESNGWIDPQGILLNYGNRELA